MLVLRGDDLARSAATRAARSARRGLRLCALRGSAARCTLVMLTGEIAAAAIVALIVIVAWRQKGSERDASPPPTPVSDADVEGLVASGRVIDAIKLHRTLHGTDLKTAKDAVDRIRAQQAGGRS
jgi:hypothetical protein